MTTLNTPPHEPARDLASMQERLVARLTRLGGRIRKQIALDGFARGFAVLVGLLALSLVLDWWLELSRPVRVLYWLVTLAAAAHFFYHYAFKPLAKRFGPIELARAVDHASGAKGGRQVAPRVATVLQLPDMLGDDEALSGNMIQSAVTRSYDSLQREDFERHVNGKHMLACVGAVAAAVVVPLVFAGLMQAYAHGAFGTWAGRWLAFSNTPYTRNTEIVVKGLDDRGRLVVPSNEAATIRVTVTNKKGEVREVEITTRPEGGKSRDAVMDRFDDSDYRYELAPTQVPVRATVRSGDNRLSFPVVPVDRPSGTAQLFYTHPADGVRREMRFDGSDGDLSLLSENDVELVITANVPIREARYTENAPGPSPIRRRGDDGRTFVIQWNHQTRERFRIELVSEEAGLVSQPIAISVGLKSDNAPRVRLRSSGVGGRITPNALIPLSIEARDDYGLASLDLRIVRDRPGEQADPDALDPLSLFAAERDEDGRLTGLPDFRQAKRELEIEDYGVRPTDVVRLTGVAVDDRYTGVQRGESTALTFRIVTHDELAREIKQRQEQARNAFRQAMEDCRDIHLALVEAEDGTAAQAQARRFRAIQREVWKVHRQIEDSAEEMRLNRLAGTREEGSRAHELIHQNVLTPMANLHRGLMDRQRDALERAGGANPEQLAALAEQQQAVIDEMNRILSAMDQWSNMIDLINQITEVIDTQRGLLKKLQDLFEQQLDDALDDAFDE